MGVDVNLYAECDPSPERLNAAEEFFKARSTLGDPWGDDPNVLHQCGDEYDRPRVEVRTLDRYYGSGYERGDWPRIYGGIRVLQAAFPEAKVYYGGDSWDEGEECTDEFLAEMWAHFLSPRGDDYRNRRQA